MYSFVELKGTRIPIYYVLVGLSVLKEVFGVQRVTVGFLSLCLIKTIWNLDQHKNQKEV